MDAPISIVDDRAALVREATALLLGEAERCLRARGRFRLALSHGPVLEDVMVRLARADAVARAGFDGWSIFWTDESLERADSHYEIARRLWLRWVPVRPANIHALLVRARSAEEAARRHAASLREACGRRRPRFDVVLLELGADGSLCGFPEGEALPRDDRWVVPRVGAVALAPAWLERARGVHVLASGAPSREALERRRAARGAHRLVPFAGPVHYWVDRDAAGAGAVPVAPDGSAE